MDGGRILQVNGVGLCVDTAGDAAAPAIFGMRITGTSVPW